MKKILLAAFALLAILIFGNLSIPNNDIVVAETKDTKLPTWQWTSGDVPLKKTAAKQSFTITFSPKIYRPRDSVKITFASYKVTVTNINKNAAIMQWRAKMSLVYFINVNWIPLVADTNDRINSPFSGRNRVLADSLTNYSVRTTVPLSRTLTLSTSALNCQLNDTFSKPALLADPAIGPTLSTSIRGIEVSKLQ